MILYFHPDKSNAFLATLEKYTSIIYIDLGGCETSWEKFSKTTRSLIHTNRERKTSMIVERTTIRRNASRLFTISICRFEWHTNELKWNVTPRVIPSSEESDVKRRKYTKTCSLFLIQNQMVIPQPSSSTKT